MTKKIKLTAEEIAALCTKKDGQDKSFLDYYPLVNGVLTLYEKEPGITTYLFMECNRLKLKRLKHIVVNFQDSVWAKNEEIKNRRLDKKNEQLTKELIYDIQHIPYSEYKKESRINRLAVWFIGLNLGIKPQFNK